MKTMYLLIDTCNYVENFQPTQHITSCEFFTSLESAKTKFNNLLKSFNEEFLDFREDDLSLHTLQIFEIENLNFVFNPNTSSYVFNQQSLLSDNYKSCDF